MNLRFLLLLYSGLATFGWGAIVLGLRLLDGLSFSLPVILAAVLSLLLGIFLLLRVRRFARPDAPTVLTPAGMALLALFVLGIATLFAISILKFPPSQRAGFAFPAVIFLAVFVTLLERLLGSLGVPVQRPREPGD